MNKAATTLGLFAILGSLVVAGGGCAHPSSRASGNGGSDGGSFANGGQSTDAPDGGGGSANGGKGGNGAGNGGSANGGDAACGPLTDKSLDSLTPCCADFGGAHCIDNVPEQLQSMVATCPGGGFCVPDDFITKGGSFQPDKCSSIGNAEGRFMSDCIPEIGKNAALLPKDDAHPGQSCVPCVNPIDKTDTGICKLGTTCNGGGGDAGGAGGAGGGGGSGPTCQDPGKPIDVSGFKPCPNNCGGVCISKALLPDPNDPQVAQLGECAPGSGELCVPDDLVASQGLGVPATCDWYGLEGRCMSECIPAIADQAKQNQVTKSNCPDHQYCAPCFNPVDHTPTGACSMQCDAGPDPAKPHDLPTCCKDIGTCMPKALAGAQADKLNGDTCPDNGQYVCVPNDLMPSANFTPQPCTPHFNLFDLADQSHDYGSCLPGCLPGLASVFLSDDGSCGDKYLCAPCWQPGFLGDSPTNAPGCQY